MPWEAYFTVKLNSVFSLAVFSSGAKHTLGCKCFQILVYM